MDPVARYKEYEEAFEVFVKEKNPSIRVVGFEPDANPCYSGGPKGPHKIVGIGPGFLTGNFKRSESRIDEIIRVPDDVSLEYTRLIPRKEGLLVGITSGAAVWATEQLLKRPEYQDPSRKIVLIFCDSGERYLTTPDLFPADKLDLSYLQ